MLGAKEECLDQFSQFGGGRAPGGECGALFAAKSVLTDPTARQEVEREFVGVAGATKCRDIRKSRRASCEQCVQTAANALFVQQRQGVLLQRPPQFAQGIASFD
jgi:hypothetical protein